MNSTEGTISERIGNLRESAKYNRIFASLGLGAAAGNFAFASVSIEGDRPATILFNLAVGSIALAAAGNFGLSAMGDSHEAAALEGALAQHELHAPGHFNQRG